jgi:DNA-binding MarR family transcriptional regulator
VQATGSLTTPATDQDTRGLAGDLYALVTYLHKSCTPDLFRAVGAVELSLTQVKLLHHLDVASEELTLKQAAEAVGVSLPAASRMVDDLVNRGFVERHEDLDDRRMKRISIADAGGEVIRRLAAARLAGIEEFVECLTASERRALARALGALLNRPEIAATRAGVEKAA